MRINLFLARFDFTLSNIKRLVSPKCTGITAKCRKRKYHAATRQQSEINKFYKLATTLLLLDTMDESIDASGIPADKGEFLS